ncbi:MAG TPA: polysaccharide pyruvyl transferase family protein, partial [Candidatus Peribacteria bacterium]|nr:polysaccharide pyruvyl transferase family protein [Candidatus Peribacteria bacterium]
RTLKAIAQSDAVVFGGGSLFTDTESWRAPVMWWWYALAAKLKGKKIVMAFQGVGPVRGFVAKRCTGLTLLWSSFISVRDPGSLKRVEAFLGESGLLGKIIVHTFDPAIAVFKGTSHESSKKLIVVPRANTTPEFLARVQVEVAKGWDEVVVLLLEPAADQHAANQVRESVKNVAVRIEEVRTFDVLVNEVASSQFVLTQRFHGAIAALANGVKFDAVPQAPGDKLDNANSMDPAACFASLKIGEDALAAFFRKG